jgi:hypothetical protein
MLIFVGVFLKVDVGAGDVLTLEAAPAGGRYNIVNLCLLGSGSA